MPIYEATIKISMNRPDQESARRALRGLVAILDEGCIVGEFAAGEAVRAKLDDPTGCIRDRTHWRRSILGEPDK